MLKYSQCSNREHNTSIDKKYIALFYTKPIFYWWEIIEDEVILDEIIIMMIIIIIIIMIIWNNDNMK